MEKEENLFSIELENSDSEYRGAHFWLGYLVYLRDKA